MEKLPIGELRKVEIAIDQLGTTPRPNGCKKLKGSLGNYWLIRVGDYRVIYSIEDKIEIIDIRRVRHRKDVYH